MNDSAQNESVLIVGAGIIGIACAHYLSRAGFKVTVIDQGTIARACSHGNCGYICPSHVLPLTAPGTIPKAITSFFNPAATFRVKPRLSTAFWNWMWQFAKRCNRRQMLTAGAHLKSLLDSSMTEFQQLVSGQSLDCEWQDSGLLYVLQTASGMRDFAATYQVLSEQFGVKARRIDGEELPGFDPALKPGLAGAYHFENDAFVRPDRLALAWSEELKSEGVTPFAEGYRLGSMMEFVGFDRSIPESRIQQLRDSAAPYLVEPFTEEVQETWYGWRPMTWDSLPIIGRAPKLDNAYLATGHNMLGMSLATGTGKLIAEFVQQQTPHIDINAFSPTRF
jgi:D-amino-acid dehydrogenase